MIPDTTPATTGHDVSEEAEAPIVANDAPPTDEADETLVLDDLLVEEVSIDGMCGVY